MPISTRCNPTYTPYARFEDEETTTVAFSQGSGADADLFTISDADLVTAGLPEGTWDGVIRNGDFETPLATDLHLGDIIEFGFDGAEEIVLTPNFPLSDAQDIENFVTLYHNNDAVSTTTLDQLSTPIDVTVQVGPQA